MGQWYDMYTEYDTIGAVGRPGCDVYFAKANFKGHATDLKVVRWHLADEEPTR